MGTTPRMTLVGSTALALAAAIPQTLAGGMAAPRAPCKYEENCRCAAPGITLRWKASYCMALAQTDDLENEDVQRCLARPDPGAVRALRACAQNAHWKAMLCRVVREKEPLQTCIRDKTFVPPFVERGPGS